MATTAFPATAIFDSGATGRDLIQAADQAAAQAAIGIDPSDYGLLDSDNTWTGDNTFDEPISAGDGSVTAPSYSFNSQSTMGIYRAATNQINMVAAAGGYGFNLQNVSLSISSTMAFGWRSTSNISQGHPYDTLLARDATGIIAQRNFFQDAPQAFRIYGTWTNASNGEWLQIDHGVTDPTKSTIASMANGTGTLREVQLVSGNSSVQVKNGLTTVKAGGQNLLRGSGAASTYLYSFNNGTIIDIGDDVLSAFSANCDLGSTTKRWANTYSVDGSFSGNLNVESDGSLRLYDLGAEGDADTQYFDISYDSVNNVSITTNATGSGVHGKMYFKTGGSSALNLTTSAIYIYRNFLPSSSSLVCGGSNIRWGGVYSVDGSYSGNLNVEAGGSQRLYNLGTDGDTDSEYLETVVDTGIYCIRTGATGTGTAIKKVYVGTGFGGTNVSRGMTVSNSDARFNFGGIRFIIAGGQITTYSKFVPVSNGALACGIDGKRWSSVASEDGDFSGNMTLSNLPTADPVVAGRLWNDSGTLKISAG